MEIWKPIKNYEDLYEVSNCGRVRGIERVVRYKCGTRQHTVKAKIKAILDNGKGYKIVNLYKENNGKMFYIHRMVAEAFITNHENKETVNHKDFDKSNNYVDNLEWASYTENNLHSFSKVGRKKQGKSIKIIAFNDKEEITIINLNEWCKENGHDRSSVYHCLSGKKIHHHGYKFKYHDKEPARVDKKYRLGKPVQVVNPEGGIFEVRTGINKWCEENGLDVKFVLRVARGERKKYQGYKFRYID